MRRRTAAQYSWYGCCLASNHGREAGNRRRGLRTRQRKEQERVFLRYCKTPGEILRCAQNDKLGGGLRAGAEARNC